MRLKKLIVATPISDARTIRSWAMNVTPAVTAPFPSVRRGFRRPDPAQDERGAEERQRVRDDRERCGEHLHQQAADARSAHVRQRPAAVDQRLPVQVPFRRDDRHEQRRVRHVEQDAQRPGAERDQVQLRHRQHVQRVADRDGGEQRGPAQVGADHRAPPPAAPVGPRAEVQPEQQAGQPFERGQVPHLGRLRVQHDDRRERQRDPRDLVAEHRDRRRAPVPPEHPLPQQRGHDPAPPHRRRGRRRDPLARGHGASSCGNARCR